MAKFRSQPPDQGKRISARAGAEEDSDKAPPKFSLRYLHGDYCISKCTDQEKVSFADKMCKLSKLTWAQLRQSPRDKLGYEKISKGSIRGGIPDVVTEDMDIIAFRFCGKAPMVGFRAQDGTFFIVWFDRGFRLYSH